jgi:hypothetical protein
MKTKQKGSKTGRRDEKRVGSSQVAATPLSLNVGRFILLPVA